ncbi:MAG: CCA tRNA nucleotidyltransferase [Caulobacterales bacterium]
MTRIAHATWLSSPSTRAVLAALEAAQPGCARFVGGCVRNALIGAPVDDIDIATQLTPDAVVAAVERAGLAAHPTGIEHGTITVVADRQPFEVTTLRRDVATDGRRATVAFTTDWTEDSARRDFRMNALYADPDGVVHDPTGGGLDDARAGRVVFIGDAETRIREDYLRILRFFRFGAWYGKGPFDPVGLAACAALRDGLASLSAERVWKETKKLLAAEDPRAALAAMAQAGVFAAVLPEADGRARLDQMVEIETSRFLPHHPLQRLAALLPLDPDVARSVARRLKLANDERDRLTVALGAEPRIVSYLSLRDVRRALYVLGRETFIDRVKRAWAAAPAGKADAQWRALLALAEGWTRPVFPLDGARVMAAGTPPGPMVGAVMREVEAWWIDADFIDDELSLAERLKAVVQGMI